MDEGGCLFVLVLVFVIGLAGILTDGLGMDSNTAEAIAILVAIGLPVYFFIWRPKRQTKKKNNQLVDPELEAVREIVYEVTETNRKTYERKSYVYRENQPHMTRPSYSESGFLYPPHGAYQFIIDIDCRDTPHWGYDVRVLKMIKNNGSEINLNYYSISCSEFGVDMTAVYAIKR